MNRSYRIIQLMGTSIVIHNGKKGYAVTNTEEAQIGFRQDDHNIQHQLRIQYHYIHPIKIVARKCYVAILRHMQILLH